MRPLAPLDHRPPRSGALPAETAPLKIGPRGSNSRLTIQTPISAPDTPIGESNKALLDAIESVRRWPIEQRIMTAEILADELFSRKRAIPDMEELYDQLADSVRDVQGEEGPESRLQKNAFLAMLNARMRVASRSPGGGC